MKEQQPLQTQRSSPLLTVLLIFVVGLPLIYFVTSGPALGYARCHRVDRFGTMAIRLESFYRPSLLVVENTPMEKSYRSYVNWWREKLEPPPPPPDDWGYRSWPPPVRP